MIHYYVGASGVGKTFKMKQKIKELIAAGESVVYMNFGDPTCEFTDEELSHAFVVNANSFTQIKKIRDLPEFSFLLIKRSNGTRNFFQDSPLVEKNINSFLRSILTNYSWRNVHIFIDEAFHLHLDQANKTILGRNNHNIYWSAMSPDELPLSKTEILVENGFNLTYFSREYQHNTTLFIFEQMFDLNLTRRGLISEKIFNHDFLTDESEITHSYYSLRMEAALSETA